MNEADRKRALRQYGKNHISGMPLLEKIRFTMNVAVSAAREGDGNRLRQAIHVLKSGVNFEAEPTMALGFMQLYLRCEQLLDEGDAFEEVLKILVPLQRAWLMAEPRQKITIRPEPSPEKLARQKPERKRARVQVLDHLPKTQGSVE